MCKLKSAIILKDSVFIPDYDSHTDMLKELKIEDTAENAERLFVRAELLPKDGDVFSPIESWEFRVDQDIRPDWFTEEYEKKRMVEAVREWATKHIYTSVNDLTLCGGGIYYIKDCKNVIVKDCTIVKAYGSASVKAWGSASVEARDYVLVEARGYASVVAWGSASVEARDYVLVEARGYASVVACGYASVKAYDSTSVKAWGSASVQACDYASVEACGYAIVLNSNCRKWKNQEKIILYENATFKDGVEKIIYQSGDWEFRRV